MRLSRDARLIQVMELSDLTLITLSLTLYLIQSLILLTASTFLTLVDDTWNNIMLLKKLIDAHVYFHEIKINPKEKKILVFKLM